MVTTKSGKLGLVTILLLSFTISCESESNYIYVPGPGFTQSITVSASVPENRNLKVGEWLELKATRMTGPWRRVKKSEDHEPGCWWTRPPPEVEEDVQSSVRWNVDPKGRAKFNIPGPLNFRKRTVRFTEPGHFRLWATSSGCEPFDSNVIEVTVVDAGGDKSGQAGP